MRQQRRQITRGLLQKRAEHNDGIVRTLKEVSLHQEKLERIGESLQRDCRELRILLLHENQIGKLGRWESFFRRTRDIKKGVLWCFV